MAGSASSWERGDDEDVFYETRSSDHVAAAHPAADRYPRQTSMCYTYYLPTQQSADWEDECFGFL